MWIVLEVPRLACKVCGATRQVEVGFAPERRRYTKRFARYVLELARCMLIWDVARHLLVSWKLVKTILGVRETVSATFRFCPRPVFHRAGSKPIA